ncbi:MAG: hypothetical protein WBE38_12475 [Terracidiphilus sp.]
MKNVPPGKVTMGRATSGVVLEAASATDSQAQCDSSPRSALGAQQPFVGTVSSLRVASRLEISGVIVSYYYSAAARFLRLG